MGKTTDDFSTFYFRRRLALLGYLDNFGEVFSAFGICLNVLATGISGGVCSEHTFFIFSICQRGDDTVCCKQDRAIESSELFTLLPPGISIVAYEVGILLESRIIVSRKHFAMCVHVDSCTFGLLQQFFHIFQVVAAYQDTRTLPYSDIYFCHFRIAIAFGIRFIQ